MADGPGPQARGDSPQQATLQLLSGGYIHLSISFSLWALNTQIGVNGQRHDERYTGRWTIPFSITTIGGLHPCSPCPRPVFVFQRRWELLELLGNGMKLGWMINCLPQDSGTTTRPGHVISMLCSTTAHFDLLGSCILGHTH